LPIDPIPGVTLLGLPEKSARDERGN